jgi:AhpD family alkylhydroperoxidase
MSDNLTVLQELRPQADSLREAIPDVWSGFSKLYRASMDGGHVPARLKEAAALAMSALVGCDGCIAAHARAAARAGASREEVSELLGVALLMGGGPVSVNAPRAWDAFLEFDGN